MKRLKLMLPSLTALSKSSKSRVIKVSKIILNVLKTKAKFWKNSDSGKTVNLLKDDLRTRLRIC